MLKRFLGFTLTLSILSSASQAALIDASEWDVTDIDGAWRLGSSGWNLDLPVSLSDADTLLSDGYTDNFDRSTVNGIFAFPDNRPSSLTFGTGGVDYYLDSFSFITTRNYRSSTVISLDYRLDGGSWINAVTTTTGSLLSPLSDCLNPATGDDDDDANLCEGKLATLDFGGVLADEWRWSRTGSQVSLHEVMMEGAAASVSVSEPSTIALFAVAGGAFLASRRRKQRS